ncbi:MAG: TIGR02281 family clan AA aspartic protease [Roseivivax sp.]|nr:TIGR02281 family clan AA aspartic protease [Roseivivax sp.]
MDGDSAMRVVYLLVLLAAVGSWFAVQNRNRLGTVMQHAAVWVLIFIGAVAAVGLWSDLKTTVAPTQAVDAQSGVVTLPRAPDGHFYVTSDVNGTPVRFVVDTGATDLVLTSQDARRAGIKTEELVYLGQADTANGVVRTAPVRLDSIAIGALIDRDVQALVNQSEMKTSLMGMRYLQRFNRVEIRNGQMVLER